MNVNFLSFPPATSHHFMCLDGMSEHSIPELRWGFTQFLFPTCYRLLVLGKGNAGWEGGSGESAVSECRPSGAWEGTGGVFLLEKVAGKGRVTFQYLKAAFLEE